VYTDHKIPGKFFNASEMARLTGAEEAVHAQQMLEGRFVADYDAANLDEEAYENSECELEAQAVQQEIVAQNNMGSDKEGQSLGTGGAALTPKDRAAQRKRERKNQKKKRR